MWLIWSLFSELDMYLQWLRSFMAPYESQVRFHVFTAIMPLLKCNGAWCIVYDKYLSDGISSCAASRSATMPKTNTHNVSLSSLNHHFNDISCVDHFILYHIWISNAINAQSRYLDDLTFSDVSFSSSVHSLESLFLGAILPPITVHVDN